MLNDRSLGHVVFDISWDEVAEVRSLVSGHHRPGDQSLQSACRAVPLRHRHRRAVRPAALLRGLRSMGAGLEGPDPGGEPEGRKDNYERIFNEGRREHGSGRRRTSRAFASAERMAMRIVSGQNNECGLSPGVVPRTGTTGQRSRAGPAPQVSVSGDSAKPSLEIYGFAMLDIGHDFKQIHPIGTTRCADEAAECRKRVR